MKQKNSDSDLVKKEFLNKRFEEFAKAFRNELTFAMGGMKKKLENIVQKQSSVYLSRFDYIIKQLEEIREDRVLKSDHDSKVKKKLENHDKRITQLEQFQKTA